MLQGVLSWGFVKNISISNRQHSTAGQIHQAPSTSPRLLRSTEEEGEDKDVAFTSVSSANGMLPMCLLHSWSAVKGPYLSMQNYFHLLRKKPPKKPVLIPALVSGILSIQGRWVLLDRSSEAPQTLRMLHAVTFLHWLHQSTLANVSCIFPLLY